MYRTLIAACAAVLLSACNHAPTVIAPEPEPIPVAIDARCFVPCDPLPHWQPDAPDGTAPWAALGELAIADAGRLSECEARRAACAAPLRRLIQVRVITNSAGQ